MNKLITIGLILLLTQISCQNQEINYENDKQLCELMYSMIENDQKYRVHDSMTDSLWVLQTEIDNYNCRQLIKIVEKRGWPDKERYNCDKPPGGVVIFRHAPEEFFPKIEKLIKSEYLAGRMGAGDYNFIKNHLEGRPMTNMEDLLKEPIIE